MPERAEIEAVEAILNRMIDAASRAGVDGTLPAERVRVECLRATYALDRVRDARGDDEGREERLNLRMRAATMEAVRTGELPNPPEAARSPQAEDREDR